MPLAHHSKLGRERGARNPRKLGRDPDGARAGNEDAGRSAKHGPPGVLSYGRACRQGVQGTSQPSSMSLGTVENPQVDGSGRSGPPEKSHWRR